MPADRSHTEYVRRRRAVAQAVRRAECAACPEEGPQGPTDKETQLSRVFGQQTYFRPQANGEVVTQSCCAPAPSCSVIVPSGTTLVTQSFDNLPFALIYEPYINFSYTSIIPSYLTLSFSTIAVIPSQLFSFIGQTYPSASIGLNGPTAVNGITSAYTSDTLPIPDTNVDITSPVTSGSLVSSDITEILNLTGVGIWVTLCEGTLSATIYLVGTSSYVTGASSYATAAA